MRGDATATGLVRPPPIPLSDDARAFWAEKTTNVRGALGHGIRSRFALSVLPHVAYVHAFSVIHGMDATLQTARFTPIQM